MLADSTIIAMIAVKDIKSAKQFYGQKLGLIQTDENRGGVSYRSGTGKVFVYQSNTAGSGRATVASWDVIDMKATIASLVDKGVTFEHYDIPGATMDGDIHHIGPTMKAAWFKDPDGNILGLTSNG
jgi:predicted enzyme related to lactoylglutathione lyase